MQPNSETLIQALDHGTATPDEQRLAATLLRGQDVPSLESRAERDRLLLEYRSRHLDKLSNRAAAMTLLARLRAYRDGEWRQRKHKHLIACPTRIRGTERELLWQILKAYTITPDFHHLRRLLAKKVEHPR